MSRRLNTRWNDILPPQVARDQWEWDRVQAAYRLGIAGVSRKEIELLLFCGRWEYASGLVMKWWNKPPPIQTYFDENVEVQIIAVYLKLEHPDPSVLVNELVGTCKSLSDVLTSRQQGDRRLLEDIDAEIFQCDACGWWCERSEETNDPGRPDNCSECVPWQDC